MIIGVPKEIKVEEYRVGITPKGVKVLTTGGHRLFIERGAGLGAGFTDDDYKEAGGEITAGPEEVYDRSEMVVKVKEPQGEEYPRLRDGLILFSFLHLAPDRALTMALVDSGVTAIAYETVNDPSAVKGSKGGKGRLPILKPMSEIAGKLAVQLGAHYLLRPNGGRGILLGGTEETPPGRVVILGGGTVGGAALQVATGLGAKVTIFDNNLDRLMELNDLIEERYKGKGVAAKMLSPELLEGALKGADLLIGGVHIPGASTPRLVTREGVATMKRGAVIVDVAVDQGGCIETTRPTTHAEPTYEVDGVLHYGVTNMPGGVPVTSTEALTKVTFPYIQKIANLGLKEAINCDISLKNGINTHSHNVTCEGVAKAHSLEYREVTL